MTPHVTVDTCLMVLELANRLVLPRLINLIESSVILEMKIQLQNGEDVHLEALELLQPSQVWNIWMMKTYHLDILFLDVQCNPALTMVFCLYWTQLHGNLSKVRTIFM